MWLKCTVRHQLVYSYAAVFFKPNDSLGECSVFNCHLLQPLIINNGPQFSIHNKKMFLKMCMFSLCTVYKCSMGSELHSFNKDANKLERSASIPFDCLICVTVSSLALVLTVWKFPGSLFYCLISLVLGDCGSSNVWRNQRCSNMKSLTSENKKKLIWNSWFIFPPYSWNTAKKEHLAKPKAHLTLLSSSVLLYFCLTSPQHRHQPHLTLLFLNVPNCLWHSPNTHIHWLTSQIFSFSASMTHNSHTPVFTWKKATTPYLCVFAIFFSKTHLNTHRHTLSTFSSLILLTTPMAKENNLSLSVFTDAALSHPSAYGCVI